MKILSVNEKAKINDLAVKLDDNNRVVIIEVSVGILYLGINEKDSKPRYTLALNTNHNLYTLCDSFKRLGSVNRYARCYDVEFEA